MASRFLVLWALHLLCAYPLVASESSSSLNTTTVTVTSSGEQLLVKPNRTGLVTEEISAGTYTVTYAPYSTYTNIRILNTESDATTTSVAKSSITDSAESRASSLVNLDVERSSKTIVIVTENLAQTQSVAVTTTTSVSLQNVARSTVATVTITQTEPMVIVWPIESTVTGSPAPTPGPYTITMVPWSTWMNYRTVPLTVVFPPTRTSTVPSRSGASVITPTSSVSTVLSSSPSISNSPNATITITRAPSTSTETSVRTFRVDGQGTIWLLAMNGTTYATYTIEGPTTKAVTATQLIIDNNGVEPFRAWSNPNDTGCANIKPGFQDTIMNDHTIKIKSVLSTLAAGESLSADVPYSFNFTPVYTPSTFVGPTTAWITDYRAALYPEVGSVGSQPGKRCSGRCGECMVFFESVSVHFWPVESPVTDCLGNGTTSIQKRGLEARSTQVIDGFTYTSPSVYVVIPTISAKDNCGTLGKVYTQVTLSFAPEEVSTVVLSDPFYPSHRVDNSYLPVSYQSLIQQFDFRYAQCPPSSLSNGNFWTVVADNGNYNPLLAAPPKITTLDPAWAQMCYVAPFQGIDPPLALTPQANLVTTTPAPPSWRPDPSPRPTRTAVQHETAPTLLPVGPTPDPERPEESEDNPSSPPPQEENGPEKLPSRPSRPNPESPSQNNGGDVPGASDGGQRPQPVQFNQPPSPNNEDGGDRPSVTICGQVITADSGFNFVVSGNTFGPGATVTVDGGSVFEVPSPVPGGLPPLTFAGQTIQPNAGGNFIVGDQTLSPGEVATISGSAVTAPMPTGSTIEDSVLKFAGETFTRNGDGEFVVDGQTLVLGGSITVDGTVLSMAYDTGHVVIDGSSTVDLGDLILEPFQTSAVDTDDTEGEEEDGSGPTETSVPQVASSTATCIVMSWKAAIAWLGVLFFL